MGERGVAAWERGVWQHGREGCGSMGERGVAAWERGMWQHGREGCGRVGEDRLRYTKNFTNRVSVYSHLMAVTICFDAIHGKVVWRKAKHFVKHSSSLHSKNTTWV